MFKKSRIIIILFMSSLFSPLTLADGLIIDVAKSGGEFTDPIEAVNSITDASSSKRYKIVIGPGTYELGFGNRIVMKPYVSIEGSGKELTFITGTVVGPTKGLIKVSEASTLNHLSVSNTVPVLAGPLVGIYLGNTRDFRRDPAKVHNVNISAHFGPGRSCVCG